MFNAIKLGMITVLTTVVVAITGALGVHASDNTLIADLDGNGTEEIVTYYEEISPLEDGDFTYSFKMTVNGEDAYEEGGLVERYPSEPAEGRLHDQLDHLKNIVVSVADVNPGKAGQELIARYYASVDDIVLGYRVFRYNDGKLTKISEFFPEAAHSYIPKAQKNNKYIKVCVETYTPALGNIWLTRNYKLTAEGFKEKESKTGTYLIAPAKYEENKLAKYKAAKEIEIFSDKNLENAKGTIAEGEKYVIKKVILTNNDTFENMKAYVKTASGVKGWILIDNTADEI